MAVRIMVFAKIAESDAEAFEKAYLAVTERMRGTAGLIGDELLRDADAPGSYVLLSEWESLEVFRAWEDGADHRDLSAPMRPYWSGAFERRGYELAGRLEPLPTP
jgi:heme-degrading monooxygenase HmoA